MQILDRHLGIMLPMPFLAGLVFAAEGAGGSGGGTGGADVSPPALAAVSAGVRAVLSTGTTFLAGGGGGNSDNFGGGGGVGAAAGAASSLTAGSVAAGTTASFFGAFNEGGLSAAVRWAPGGFKTIGAPGGCLEFGMRRRRPFGP